MPARRCHFVVGCWRQVGRRAAYMPPRPKCEAHCSSATRRRAWGSCLLAGRRNALKAVPQLFCSSSSHRWGRQGALAALPRFMPAAGATRGAPCCSPRDCSMERYALLLPRRSAGKFDTAESVRRSSLASLWSNRFALVRWREGGSRSAGRCATLLLRACSARSRQHSLVATAG